MSTTENRARLARVSAKKQVIRSVVADEGMAVTDLHLNLAAADRGALAILKSSKQAPFGSGPNIKFPEELVDLFSASTPADLAAEGERPSLLAYIKDGVSLTRAQGLVRLIVPSETDDALRQVKWVGRIIIE